ncbi:MAG: hypothetical protein GY853_01515 [PVC group bacterium]|nr:hypothetical protein [PVC group bacterium]
MADLKILRVNKSESYKTIKLDCIEDSNLSWKAKGIHTYLISRPPDWKAWRTDLINKSKDGKDSVSSAIKELKEFGYLYNYTIKGSNGRFLSNGYYVLETPVLDKKVIKEHLDRWNIDEKEVNYTLIDYNQAPPDDGFSGSRSGRNADDSPYSNKVLDNKNKEVSFTNVKDIGFSEKENPTESSDKSFNCATLFFTDKKINNAEKLDETNKYVEYWNSKSNLITHKTNTKVYQDSAKMFGELEKGIFIKRHRTLNFKHLEDFGVPAEMGHREWGEEELYKAIDRADFLQTPDAQGHYNNKSKQYRSCKAWLLNEKNGCSCALIHLYKDPDLKMEKIKDERVLKLYRQALRSSQINDTELCALVKGVNYIVSQKALYEQKIGKYINLPLIKGDGFYTQHINFLQKKFSDFRKGGIYKLYGLWLWKEFVIWMKQTNGNSYDLDPSEEKILDAKTAYEEHKVGAEIREREKREHEKQRQNWAEKKKNRGVNKFQMAAV